MKPSKQTPSVIAAALCQRRNHSCSSRTLDSEPATQWSHPRIRAIHAMADPQIRAIHAMAASGRFIPYRRRVFPVPNFPAVPDTVLRQISCCQVKQVWKILIQRSRSEARPYILLLIYFILLFRPSISPLLIEYFMAFLMGEMSRWTLFTKLTTSP